jgi:hypothetical protein
METRERREKMSEGVEWRKRRRWRRRRNRLEWKKREIKIKQVMIVIEKIKIE